MRGFIKNDLTQQSQTPKGPRFYEKGDEVQIKNGVYRDGVLWYIVDDNIQVNSFQVQTDLYSGLRKEDASQFFICYRKLDASNNPIADDVADAPDTLHFAHLSSPTVRVNKWAPNIFASAVAGSVAEMDRKHVFVYIHGYDWQPGLKLDLAAKFVQSYMNHPENSVAKMLYFSWPSFGARKDATDRSVDYGQRFTQNGLFIYFKMLAEALKAQGKTLNLIVHSFGHQLLNGMINPGEGNRHQIPRGIFENIFLMAPDITHLAVQKKGVTLRNPKKTSKGRHYYYNLAPLKDLGNHVYIYYNSSDYLLYVSTKQSNGGSNNGNFSTAPDSMGITTDYRNLGSFGKDIFEELNSTLVLEPGFEFVNVQKLFEDAGEEPGNLAFFPFQNNTDEALPRARKGDYSGIKVFEGFINGDLLLPHHQYLFTCKPVVDDVLKRLKGEGIVVPPNEVPGVIA